QQFDPTRLMLENYIPIHAALFDLNLIRQQPQLRFDTSFDLFEDWDFWLQLLQHGPFVHVPGVSAWYHIHGQSGAGVRMEQADQATAALGQLLDKWRKRWSGHQLAELTGLARHVYPLQEHLQAEQLKADQLTRDQQILLQNMAELEQLHAAALQASQNKLEAQ